MNRARDPATCARDELAYLDRWQRRPGGPGDGELRQLVHNEFLEPERYTQVLTRRLRAGMEFSASQVPYWRERFAESGFTPAQLESPADLARLPVLSRAEVRQHHDRLQPAPELLAGQQVLPSTTTGSTGLPVTVQFTAHARRMAPLMWQRLVRWARLDLTQRIAQIRIPKALFRNPDGSMLQDGHSAVAPRWQFVGDYYHTGDEVHFNVSNPRPMQLDWLRRFEPAYLVTFPGLLEELALANDGKPLPFIKALLPISSMLTVAMRARIEQTFRVPFHQIYGLNEVGVVATRCAAGRYHSNIELAWVEIVDAQGQPVPPGAAGRLVVTTLSNQAMPLFRYDTGDIATASAGPCPCGRTLPTFEDILGRHIRFAGTPPETRPRLNGLLAVLSAAPNELFTNIRQYQIHQTLDRDFEIHVAASGPLNPGFEFDLRDKWAQLNQEWGAQELRIVLVDAIPQTPSGKQLDFVSAFHEREREFQRNDGAGEAGSGTGEVGAGLLP